MILKIQFQILINIGRVNPIVCVIFVFAPLFDDFFHIAFGYTISL